MMVDKYVNYYNTMPCMSMYVDLFTDKSLLQCFPSDQTRIGVSIGHFLADFCPRWRTHMREDGLDQKFVFRGRPHIPRRIGSGWPTTLSLCWRVSLQKQWIW